MQEEREEGGGKIGKKKKKAETKLKSLYTNCRGM